MNKKNTILIPAEAVEQSRFQPGEHIAVHVGENTLVVIPEKLTALQAVNAIALLADVGSELVDIVKGTCEDQIKAGECLLVEPTDPDQCFLDSVNGPGVTLSNDLREQAGIPQDAKLEVFVDEGEVMIAAADYKHDITDVPPAAREVLMLAGVCSCCLDQLIISEKIIHEA